MAARSNPIVETITNTETWTLNTLFTTLETMRLCSITFDPTFHAVVTALRWLRFGHLAGVGVILLASESRKLTLGSEMFWLFQAQEFDVP